MLTMSAKTTRKPTRRKGTPRDTTAANNARRDPLGRVSDKARLLMAAEVWEWANTLTPEERGNILAAEMQRRQQS